MSHRVGRASGPGASISAVMRSSGTFSPSAVQPQAWAVAEREGLIAAEAGVQGYAPASDSLIEAELAAGRRIGAQLIVLGDPDYPEALSELSDAPPILWAIGDTALLRRPMVALVGARNASSLGTRMARNLAAGLGQAGIVVVSGLARGVDAAAHQAGAVILLTTSLFVSHQLRGNIYLHS